MPTMPDTLRWSHVGLNCRDQKATEEFYTRYFGFRRARVADAEGTRIIFLRRGEALLELFPSTAEPAPEAENDGPATPGIARHLAFQVDDVDAFLALAGDDAHITLGPLKFDEYIPGWKTVWVRDPDGVIIEVSQGYVDQTPEELEQYA
ncbi:VOC family protein [Sphaerisporangium sp. NPDC051011]|uniref:VOC family protein n=2 Tax=unclassified Sphaerisporangium TaxID=2630420 RepID=UPI0033E868B8